MHLQKSFKLNTFLQRIISGSIFLIIFWSAFFISPIIFSILIFAILLEILIFEWKNLFKPTDIKFWLLMPIYPILPFLLIIYLNLIGCHQFLLIIFVLVFCFDSGSYISGNFFGKNKIAPKISPGKTWEGLIGGFLSVLFGTNLIFLFLKLPLFDLDLLILFSFSVSIFAFLGDLFESYLKRRAGIKDTGNLMPGHGGLLDRFDSILFAVFFLFFIL